MDDRTKAGLRGSVSVCRSDETVFILGCTADGCDSEPREQTSWTITRYQLDGRMAQYHRHKHDGSEWISTYDAAGKVQETETREATGLVSKTIYHYDQEGGRLQRVTGREGDSPESILQTFTYDDQHKTKTQYFHSMPGRAVPAVIHYTVEGSDTAYPAPGAISMTTVYGDQGRPSETLFHDSQQRVLSRVTLRYDDAGRLVEESQTTEMEETLPPDMHPRLNAAQLERVKAVFGLGVGGQRYNQLHRYDTEGRRVETVIHIGALASERKVMAYDQHGDRSEEKSFHNGRPFSLDGQGRIVDPGEASAAKIPSSETTFSYQYDEHGNWIERVVSARQGPDKPFTVCGIDRRSLSYYAD